MKFEEQFEPPVLIGEGAFGRVYRVKDRKSGAVQALKVTEHEPVWQQEKRFLSLAEHPLFPKCLDAGAEDGKYYILMEYIWGGPLDVVLDRRRGFGQTDGVRLGLSVADGLAWLQEQDGKILFRDLKAENLILQPDGNVRLVDFGSACMLEEAAFSRSGTPGAAAPEQLSDAGKTGTYSDVYAFGRLLHYLITGENPLYAEPEPLRTIDPGYSACLELLLEDCLRPAGEERLPDMYCVLERLMEIVTASPRDYRRMEKEANARLSGRYGTQGDVSYTKNVR